MGDPDGLESGLMTPYVDVGMGECPPPYESPPPADMSPWDEFSQEHWEDRNRSNYQNVDPNFSGLDGFLEVEARLHIPYCADYDRDGCPDYEMHSLGMSVPVSMLEDNYHWYNKARLSGGEIGVNVSLGMVNGALFMGRGDEDEPTHHQIITFEDTVLRNLNAMPNFEARSIANDDEGDPHMNGELSVIGHPDYAESLRLLSHLPYGIDGLGNVVCDEDDRDQVEGTSGWFSEVDRLRRNGVPTWWQLTDLMNLAQEMMQVPPDQVCLDPDVVFRLPPDPQNIPSEVTLYGGVRIHDDLTIPETPMTPALGVDVGEGAYLTVEATLGNPAADRNAEGTCSAELSTLEARVNAGFDLVSVTVGDKRVDLPLQGNFTADIGLRGVLGEFRNPLEMLEHIRSHGELLVTGDIHVPGGRYSLGGQEIDIPEILIQRGQTLTRLSSGLTLYRNPFGGVGAEGRLTAHLDTEGIVIGDIAIPGYQTMDVDLTGEAGAINLLASGVLTLPYLSFPLPVSAALHGGSLQVNQFGLFMDPQTEADHYTGGFSVDVALQGLEGHYGDQALSAEGTVLADGEFTVNVVDGHGPMISTSLSFDVDLSGDIDTHPNEVHLLGGLVINDLTETDALSGEVVVRRHFSLDHVSAALGLDVEGLSATGGLVQGPTSVDLEGQTIQPGIHLAADLADPIHLGDRVEADMNLGLEGVRVEIPEGMDLPQGAYILGGNFVGRVDLVNISENPARPEFRVVVGSLRAEIRDIQLEAENVEGLDDSVTEILESGLINGGTISIQDSEEGVIHTEIRADSLALEALSFILSREAGTIFESDIEVDPYAIESHVTGDGQPVPTIIRYYEPHNMDRVAINNIVLNFFQRNLGLLTITGNAAITQIFPGEDDIRHPELTFEMDHNVGRNRRLRDLPEDVDITVSGGGGHVTGTVHTTLDADGQFSVDDFTIHGRAFPFRSVTVNGVEVSLPGETSGQEPERGVMRFRVTENGFTVDGYSPQSLSIDDQEILSVQGDRRFLHIRGRNRDDGTLRSVVTDVTFPESLTVNVSREAEDGTTILYQGTLTASDPSHPEATTPPTLSTTTRVSRHGRGTIPETSEDLQLTGTLRITERNSEGVERVLGEVQVNQRTQWVFSGDFNTEGQINARLSVPELSLEATVLQDLTIGGQTIAAGGHVRIPVTGFGTSTAIDARALTATLDWTAPNFGEIEVDGTVSSLGEVHARATIDNGGQQWQALINSDGVSVRALPGEEGDLRPVRVEVSARVGESQITFESQSRAGEIAGRYDAETGEIILDVSNIHFRSVVDGHVEAQGLDLALNEVGTQAALPQIEVRYNVEANTLRVVVTAPEQPAMERPWEGDDAGAGLEAWRGRTEAQWVDYARTMHDTTHLVTLSESAADVSGSAAFLPQGRGEVYIDFRAPLDLTIDLDAVDSPEQLTQLMNTFNGNLQMRRQFPNPPPQTTGEPVIFNEAQSRAMATVFESYPVSRVDSDEVIYGALFFVNPNDTQMISRIGGALGITPDEAIEVMTRGRMEIIDLYNHDNMRPVRRSVRPEDFKNLILAGLTEGDWSRELTGRSYRTLFFVQDLRENLETLVQPMEVPSSRSNPHHGAFARQFSEAEYHSRHAATDGADMVMMGVLPLHPQNLFTVVSDMNNAEEWDGWVSMSSTSLEDLQSGQAWGVVLDEFPFTVDTGTRSFGSEEDGYVHSFYYNLSPDSHSGFLVRSRHDILLPLRGRRGTLLIRNQFNDFAADGRNYEDIHVAGRSLRDPTADPDAMPDLIEGVVGMITGLMDRIANINVPGQVSYAEYLTMMNRVYARYRFGDRGALDYQRVSGLHPYFYPVQGGVREVRQAHEFLSFGDVPNEEGPAIRAMMINADTAPNRETLQSLITNALGVDEAEATRWIEAGHIPLTDLQQVPFLRDNYAPEVIEGLVNALLMPVDVEDPRHPMYSFNRQSERFFDVLGDIRRRRSEWQRGRVDFRAYNNTEYLRYGGTNTDRADTVNATVMFSLPGPEGGGATTARYLEVIHATGDYDDIATDYDAATEVACAEGAEFSGRVCSCSILSVPALADLYYCISGPHDYLTFSGGVLMSHWSGEVQNHWSDQPEGMLDNTGWWMGIPDLHGNTDVIRPGHINTRHAQERQVASTARERFTFFIEGIFRRAQNPSWTTGEDDPETRFSVGEVFEVN